MPFYTLKYFGTSYSDVGFTKKSFTKTMVSYRACIFFHALLCNFAEANVEKLWHVSRERDSVLLHCCGQNTVENRWKYEGEVISFNNHLFNNMEGFASIVTNFSLLFKSVLIIHEGEYECVRDSSVVSRYRLVVQGLRLNSA